MFQSKIFEKMTAYAKNSLLQANELARNESEKKISPTHLLRAIYLEKGSLGSNTLKDLGFDKEHFSSKKKNGNLKLNKETYLPFSPSLSRTVTQAYAIANSFNYPYVGTEHLVYALTESTDKSVREIFQKISFDEKKIKPFARAPLGNDFLSDLPKSVPLPDISFSKTKKNDSSQTPYLNQFCVNLNKEVEERNEIISGRDDEIERIIHILGRKTKNNPLLIGDPGIGKTALVSGLAKKINSGKIPGYLLNKTIYSLDMALLVAGTTFRGEFENRLKEVISEATRNKKVILFIDELHGIVGAGNSQGSLDAANILKPALSKGDIQCIGATTYAEHKKYIEKDPALARRFQPIQLFEPSKEVAKLILKNLSPQFEKFHNVAISEDALDASIELSVRYIADRFLPDKAIDVLDETASALKNKNAFNSDINLLKKYEDEFKEIVRKKELLVQQHKYEFALELQKKESALSEKISQITKKQSLTSIKKTALTKNDVALTISKITGIPIEKISAQKNNSKIADIEKRLNEKIIGQKNAIKIISDVFFRSYSGISNPDRPAGSFLFLGPTGVGKTLTSKIIAQEIFSSENAMIRIDMSEFSEKHTLSRLVGAPAGYIGFGEGGSLTEKVRHKPYSLILFDEIEKAHPDILNILLQILEDGILTDAEGRSVNFKNTIIILTSNIGTAEFTGAAKLGFQSSEKTEQLHQQFESIKNNILKEIYQRIKPEIINRLDHIIVFDALSEETIEKIVDIEMKKLSARLKKNSILLKIHPQILRFITKKSYSTEYGARSVRKNIQDLVETKIAQAILKNQQKKNFTLHLKNNDLFVE
ncbi:MAG: hypothetical protein ACD_11C00004G0030 [uncultured bacterium]|nr:MAG: hypothetical protein ACD_11C00004G0030 [uncultured bacterium]HBR71663.1 ATP-dependent Clp protease ATP-binding subunit ClpC [Candidatus Moranbacteria bacterium]